MSNRTRNYRKENLSTRYGLSLSDYDYLASQQMNLCAICLEPEPNGKFLNVDHDHATGEIRGLLCTQCNLALGKFRDNEFVLRAAIMYLRKAAE